MVKVRVPGKEVKENEQPLKEKEVNNSRRQSAGRVSQANDRPATKKRLKGDRPSSGYWYLQDTAELEGVTAEAFNEALGIREIKVYDPSDKQWENGTLATITLETIIGQVKGIQVLDSERDDSIYLRMQSRSWEGNDGKKNYVNDLKLDRKVEAQILRHISGMLEDVE